MKYFSILILFVSFYCQAGIFCCCIPKTDEGEDLVPLISSKEKEDKKPTLTLPLSQKKEECAVCLDPLGQHETELIHGTHWYHRNCITGWWQAQRKKQIKQSIINLTCPLCHTVVKREIGKPLAPIYG